IGHVSSPLPAVCDAAGRIRDGETPTVRSVFLLLVRLAVTHQAEVDLALLQAGLHHDDADAVAQTVFAPGLVAGERLADRIEAVVVVGQLGDVDQAVDLGLVQLHEQAEAGDAADHAVELAAD